MTDINQLFTIRDILQQWIEEQIPFSIKRYIHKDLLPQNNILHRYNPWESFSFDGECGQ